MKTQQIIHKRGDRKTSVAIRPETHRKLKIKAAGTEQGVSHLADKLINDGLKRQNLKSLAN